MKYLKLYEQFDFNDEDFDYEEEESIFKIGDYIKVDAWDVFIERTESGDLNGRYTSRKLGYRLNGEIKDIQYRKDGKIVLKIRDKFPWYLADDLSKYNTINENFDWDEDDFDFEEEEIFAPDWAWEESKSKIFQKGDICMFVGKTDENGEQMISATQYIGKICRVVDTYNNNELWVKVVFTRENGSKYYTNIAKVFLKMIK